MTRAIALALVMAILISSEVTAAWYGPNWQYRKEITIPASQVVANLTDFPVLIQLASDAQLSSGARADGFDILFTSDDGTTKLDHEIEQYVTGTGELVAWVKAPSLSSTVDNTLYVYYGFPTSPDQGSANVWSNGFDAVWHWDDDFLDSANANHGTNQGSSDAAAKFADGQSFDGVNDYVDLSTMNPKVWGDFTISAWYKSTDLSVSDDEYIFMHYAVPLDDEIVFGPTDDGGDALRLGVTWGGSWEPYYSSTDVVDQNWHHLVAVRGGGRMKIWVDGTKEVDVADPHSGSTLTLDNLGPFAGDDPGNTEQVHGTVDELRIADVGRADGWVQTEFNNQDDPSAFFTLGAEEVLATLIGRYWMNETIAGQGPTQVLDDQPSPLHLDITYDGTMAWTLDSGHRGLNSTSQVLTGIVSKDAVGSKYVTNLDGVTKASFVTVAEWEPTPTTQRVAGFQGAGARVATFATSSAGRPELWVRTNIGSYGPNWLSGAFADGTRHVLHFIFDSEEPVADDRIRLYIDGVNQGAPSSPDPPGLGETLDMSGSLELAMMNRVTVLDKGMNGTVFYYAAYAGEMTDAEITADAAALLADDDNLTAYSVSGTIFEDVDFAGTASAYDGGVTDVLVDSVWVEIYDADAGDAFVSSTATGRTATGAYSFSVPDGNYKVRARSSSLGDTDSAPAGGLNGSVPGTWPYPLPELTWAHGGALYGGQSPTVDDTDTGDEAGPGDTYVTINVSGGDVTGVDFGFAYNLIVQTADDGLGDTLRSDQGSLRQFIKNANAIGTAGSTTANSSEFRMQVAANQTSGGSTWWRFTPTTPLPRLEDSGAMLDGSTQRINSGTDSNALGPEIELYGASAGASNGLRLTAGTSTIRELSIGDFGIDAIDISGGHGHTIVGNYLGTDATGAVDLGNSNDGIDVAGADSCFIGGIGVDDRNVIAYNNNEGINFSGGTTVGNTVVGNYVGVAADGTTAAGNGDVGIAILSGSDGNKIGGLTVPERNVISMNFEGIEIGSSNNTVRGNYIGTDKDGALNRGHTSSDAVEIIGSASGNTIEGNLIAFTKAGFHGVSVQGGTGNGVLGNQIHSNTGLGINLGASGVDFNDGAKTGGQPNLLMDHPVFTAASLSGTTLTVAGYVGSAPSQSTFANARVEIFESDDDGTGFGEGMTFLDFLTADGNGDFSGSIDVTGKGLVVGEKITGTATDGSNNTSEFGANFVVANGGWTVSGSVFEDADFAGTAAAYDGGVNDVLVDSVDVELYDADNSDAFVASTSTGRTANGVYSFSGLTDGNYKVRVRAATLGDTDSPPSGGLNGTVPGTWPYPLPDMTWGNGSAMYGGQAGTSDDTDTADDAGPGDNWVAVSVSGGDVTSVDFGFAYNLIVNVADDGLGDTLRSDQGSLRQFIKNANAIGTAGSTTANSSQFRMLVPPNEGSAPDSLWQITTASELPHLSDDGTVVDGTTQTAILDRNTLGPEIGVFGNGIGGDGITVSSSSCEIRGLLVNGFSSSFQSGILISGASATSNTVAGNYVGTNYAGSATVPNYYGVRIDGGAQSNTIGGVTAGDRNLISGNAEIGLSISGLNTDANIVRGNYVGPDRTGMVGLGSQEGIDISSSADNNTIGGTSINHRNIVAGNSGTGIEINNSDGNTVSANFVGTTVDGMSALGNLRGIWIASGSQNNTIGGNTATRRNLISGNTFLGLIIAHTNTSFNVVQGNFIGTDTTGVAPVPNANQGIQLAFSASGNVIGGTASGEANTIAFNTGDGIWLQSVDTDGNRISANSIFSNGALGIDIDPDGPGTGSGANDDKPAPVITSLSPAGSDFVVVASAAAADTVEFFRVNNAAAPTVVADGSGDGEGFLYLGRCVDGGNCDGPHMTAAADGDPAAGSVQGTLLSSGTTAGDYVTATATDPTSGTSEFATNMVAQDYEISGSVFEDVDFAGTATAYDGGVTDVLVDSVWVELYDADDSDAFVASTATGRTASGVYEFTGLSDGNYKVRVRSVSIGDADSPPAGGLNGTVPATWPYPLPEMTWGNGSAVYGGQDAAVDDADTAADAGPGDTYLPVSVSGSDVTGVDFGFAYNLIIRTADDGLADNTRSDQGSLRQFLKNANAIGAAGSTTASQSEFRMQVAANQSDGGDSWWRIVPTAALPAVSDDDTMIDGSTQRLNSGTDSNSRGPEIEVFGNSLSADGFSLQATRGVVRELAVSGFDGEGIDVAGAPAVDNEVFGCYVGTDAIGENASSNLGWGIWTRAGAAGTVIGSGAAGDGNLIGYNALGGVLLGSSGAADQVIGNVIRNNTLYALDSETDGALIVGNLIRANQRGLRLRDDSGTAANNNSVYHNTVHGTTGGSGILVEGQGAILRNNIVTGNVGYGIEVTTGTMTESHNNVTDASTSPANTSGRSNGVLDATDLNMDPIYGNVATGDFTLTECTSPSINVGLDLGVNQPDMNGGDAGLFNGLAPDQGAFESTCTTLPLSIVKRAFLSDGTSIPHGEELPRGTPVQYLLYVNNTGPARTDVSFQDVLDVAFEYQSGTIRFDGSVAACVSGTCDSVEELAIFTAVNAQTAGTDAVDADIVSYTGGSRTIDVGNASQPNLQLDIPANAVYGILFLVKVR